MILRAPIPEREVRGISQRAPLQIMAQNIPTVFDAIAKVRCERSLIDFVELFWPVLNPGQRFVRGWVQEVIAKHLEAVTRGDILKLLINVPPGFTKSVLVGVMWCAWEWGPQKRPDLRYISWSYDVRLTMRDNVDCRKIIESELYQRLWGQCAACKVRRPNAPRCKTCETDKRFRLDGDQNEKRHFTNDWQGFRLASSTGGAGTGWRADRLIVDDPHSVQTAESDTQREEAVNWFAAMLPTRVRNTDGSTKAVPLPAWVKRAQRIENDNNNDTGDKVTASATVCIMQRVNLRDIAGVILDTPELGYAACMIEMEYTPEHPAREVDPDTGKSVLPPSPIKYEDPRPARLASVPADVEAPKGAPWALYRWAQFCNLWTRIAIDMATLADPVRFPRHEVERIKAQMRLKVGDDAVEAQFQQWPITDAGAMFPEKLAGYIMEGDLEPPLCGFETRGWDLAASESKKAAATVGVRLYIDASNRVIIRHSAKIRGGPDKVDKHIVGTAENDGPDVHIDIPQDPAAGGKYMIHSFVKQLVGFVVEWSTESDKGKVGRAMPLSSQWKAGNVYIVRTGDAAQDAWIKDYLRIVRQFPVGTFKDEVDASARALDNQVRAAPAADEPAAAPMTIRMAR